MYEGMSQARKERFEAAKGILSLEEKRAVGSLAIPLRSALKQIESEVRSGAYRAVIGDDVSGRLPAIAVTEVLRGIYKAHGHDAPILRFLAGGRRDRMTEWVDGQIARETEMLDRAEGIKEELGEEAGRVLVVTEAVRTGDNMKLLIKSLKQAGLEPDLLSVGFLGDYLDAHAAPISREEVEKKLGTRLIVGSDQLPSLWGQKMRHLHGVEKQPGSATAVRKVPERDIHQEVDDPERLNAQMKVNAARVFAIRVGDDLTKDFLKEPGSEVTN